MTKTITKNDIEHGFNYTNKILRVWESSGNPHGPNNEFICTLNDIKVNNDKAGQCMNIIKNNFSEAIYNALLHEMGRG